MVSTYDDQTEGVRLKELAQGFDEHYYNVLSL
jgi:hypothetical protein